MNMMKFPSGKWGSRRIGKKALCGNRYLNVLLTYVQKPLLDDRLSTPDGRGDCPGGRERGEVGDEYIKNFADQRVRL
jgi:hypothetical protein